MRFSISIIKILFVFMKIIKSLWLEETLWHQFLQLIIFYTSFHLILLGFICNVTSTIFHVYRIWTLKTYKNSAVQNCYWSICIKISNRNIFCYIQSYKFKTFMNYPKTGIFSIKETFFLKKFFSDWQNYRWCECGPIATLIYYFKLTLLHGEIHF